MTSSPEKNTDNNSQVIEKVDYVFKIIGRYDTYINSTNTKASLVIRLSVLSLKVAALQV